MQNLVVLTYLMKYLTLIGKIFIRIWNYYYILNEYQKLLTMLPSIEKYDNTYKFTLQVTSHIDGVAFHWFFLIPQQLTKWILSHQRYTIATFWMSNYYHEYNFFFDSDSSFSIIAFLPFLSCFFLMHLH